MIQLKLTDEGLSAFTNTLAHQLTLTRFVFGSSYDENEQTIQDESPVQFNIDFQETYLKGQTYQRNGSDVVEEYNHIKIIGYFSADNVSTFDENGEYVVHELALMGSTTENANICLAYGYDIEGVKLYENTDTIYTVKLDLIFDKVPNISVNNSVGTVTYRDFLDHVNKPLGTSTPVHGLQLINNRLYINGQPLTIDVEGVSNAKMDNIIGINEEVEVLPATTDYSVGDIIALKDTGAMYEVIQTLDNNNQTVKQWQILAPVNSQVKLIKQTFTPFPSWKGGNNYSVGDICINPIFDSYKYLECVEAGITGTNNLNNANIGQLITDGTAKWLVCDWRDSAPVGTFKTDIVQRLGWLKANGATLNRADYPRLWAWAVDNNLTTNDQTNNPGLFGVGDGVDTFELPDYEDYFVRYSYVRNVGSKQNSQMAEHNHSCGNQDTSHNHTFKYNQYTVQSGSNYTLNVIGGSLTYSTSNQSASHKHSIGNTGSGDNTYPDNITMQMFIKY